MLGFLCNHPYLDRDKELFSQTSYTVNLQTRNPGMLKCCKYVIEYTIEYRSFICNTSHVSTTITNNNMLIFSGKAWSICR